MPDQSGVHPATGPSSTSLSAEESVGYAYLDVDEALARSNPDTMTDGWNTMPDGEKVFDISTPSAGLWSTRDRLYNRWLRLLSAVYRPRSTDMPARLAIGQKVEDGLSGGRPYPPAMSASCLTTVAFVMLREGLTGP